jgi:hypothetical protein
MLSLSSRISPKIFSINGFSALDTRWAEASNLITTVFSGFSILRWAMGEIQFQECQHFHISRRTDKWNFIGIKKVSVDAMAPTDPTGQIQPPCPVLQVPNGRAGVRANGKRGMGIVTGLRDPKEVIPN